MAGRTREERAVRSELAKQRTQKDAAARRRFVRSLQEMVNDGNGARLLAEALPELGRGLPPPLPRPRPLLPPPTPFDDP